MYRTVHFFVGIQISHLASTDDFFDTGVPLSRDFRPAASLLARCVNLGRQCTVLRDRVKLIVTFSAAKSNTIILDDPVAAVLLMLAAAAYIGCCHQMTRRTAETPLIRRYTATSYIILRSSHHRSLLRRNGKNF